MSSHQRNSKDDRPVLIFKAISDHLFPVADLLLRWDGKDRHGLETFQVENTWPAITRFTIMTAN